MGNLHNDRYDEIKSLLKKSKMLFEQETQEDRQIATQDIIQQIRQILPYAPAYKSKNNPYGMRLKVTIRIKGFNGGQGNLITIWQIDQGKIIPRLITNWLEVDS